MGSDFIRLLLIEDNPIDARVICEHLAHTRDVRFQLDYVERLSTGLDQLSNQRFDAVLMDLNLPDSTGLETLTRVHECNSRIPIVVLTGANPQEISLEALKAGAEDYLAKDDLEPKLLVRTIRYAIERAGHRRADREYRDQVEKTLRESEQRYRDLLAAVTTYTYSVTFMNGEPAKTRHTAGCITATGYFPEEYFADPYLWFRMIHPDDRERVQQYVAQVLKGQRTDPIEHRILHKNGSLHWIRSTIVQRHDETEGLVGYDGLVEDVTKRKEAEDALRERESHLLAAQVIQKKLWPKAQPVLAGFDIAGASFPAEFAAGDYFDYLPLADGSMGIVIGDVAGHGLGPAMVMALTYAHLRSLVRIYNDLGEILAQLNQLLRREVGPFVTIVLGRLSIETRSFVCVNAGHPSVYVFDHAGNIKARLDSKTIPLGISEDAGFPLCDPVALKPGDTILLMTDGVEEAGAPNGPEFGIDRALQVARSNLDRPAAEIIRAIHDAAEDFCLPTKPCDDITAIAIKVGPEVIV